MDKKTRTEHSYLNIIAGVGGYSISIILSLINRMVFTRTLPAAYLGVNGLFSNILSMLSLAELGIGGAVVYALYKPIADGNREKIASIVQFFGKAYNIIGCVIGGMGICLMPFLTLIIGEQPDINDNLYVIFGLYLFNVASSYFFTYKNTLLTAAQQNYYNTALNYAIISVQAIIQSVYLLVTREYMGYLIIQVLGGLIYYILSSKLAIKKHPYIVSDDIKPLSKEEEKSIFRNVRDLMVYKVSGVLVNGTDNIIITFFDGLLVTGLASNYTLLVTTLSTLLNQIFNSVTASIGNLNATETKERRFEMLNMFSLANFWLFAWGAVGIIFVSSDLVHLMFGKEYVLNIRIPIVMALNFYTVGMMNVIWNFKHTMGLFRYGRFVQFGTAVLNLILSIIFGQVWGVFGILFATFLSRAFTNLWYDPYVIYKYGFRRNPMEYLIKYVKYLVVLLISVILSGVACGFVKFSIITNIFLKTILCTVIPNGLFYLIYRNSYEYKIMLNLIDKGLVILRTKLKKLHEK